MKITICDVCQARIVDPEAVWYLNVRRPVLGCRQERELCPACMARIQEALREEVRGCGK